MVVLVIVLVIGAIIFCYADLYAKLKATTEATDRNVEILLKRIQELELREQHRLMPHRKQTVLQGTDVDFLY